MIVIQTNRPLGKVTDKIIEDAAAELKNAKNQGKPFVIEWQHSHAQAQHLEDESGAGCNCGSGPVD
jgi:hypothetical protein